MAKLKSKTIASKKSNTKSSTLKSKAAPKAKAAKPKASVFADNKKGSSELVLEINGIIKTNLKKKDFIFELIKEGKKELKAFASVQSYLSEVEKLLKKNPLSLSEYVHNYERDFQAAALKIYKKAKPLFKDVDSIVTLSNSGTVFSFLKMLSKENKNLRVTISESRPVMEGRIMAKKLLKDGIQVELITEAMLPFYINQSDAVLIGADVLLKNGNVVNKTGSRAAAIIARYFNKPFYVLAERVKSAKGTSFDKGDHPSDEVWNIETDNLKVPNYYFEEIREDLITKVITD